MQLRALAALAYAALCLAGAADPDPRAEFERRLAPYRKLSDDIPEACIAACPGLGEVANDYKAAESSQPTSDAMSNMDVGEIAGAFGKMYVDIFAVICANQDAFKCAGDNAIVCGAEETQDGSTDMSVAKMATQLDCMCTDCPTLPRAFGGFAGYFMGHLVSAFSGAFDPNASTPAPRTEEEMLEESLEVLCPMVNSMKCGAAASSCTDQEQQVGGFSMVTSSEPLCTEKGYSLEAANDPPTASSASAAIALMPGIVAAPYAVLLFG